MRIVIIGSGNIAHFFLPRLQAGGHSVVQIYSPNIENASTLAQLHGIGSYTNLLSEIVADADAYMLAVKDDALAVINDTLRLKDKLVIHCAGAIPLDAISDISNNRAVIWTLYSIKKSNLPQTNQIPLIVEAVTEQALQDTLSLANAISGNVLQVDFEQRQMMHLNAVLVNNFTNHLFTIAQKLSEEHRLPFSILQPIIEQTFLQIQHTLPSESQTGPAIRKDDVTMQKHLALLSSHPEWQQIYIDMSKSILNSIKK